MPYLPPLLDLVHFVINQMSTLSFKEETYLIANILRGFQGENKTKHVDTSKYTPEQVAIMNAALGTVENKNKIFNLVFTNDLDSYTVYNFDYLITLYFAYNDHHNLPFPGSVSEQPNKIIEVFNLFKSVIHEVNEQERKKIEKQNKRK